MGGPLWVHVTPYQAPPMNCAGPAGSICLSDYMTMTPPTELTGLVRRVPACFLLAATRQGLGQGARLGTEWGTAEQGQTSRLSGVPGPL